MAMTASEPATKKLTWLVMGASSRSLPYEENKLLAFEATTAMSCRAFGGRFGCRNRASLPRCMCRGRNIRRRGCTVESAADQMIPSYAPTIKVPRLLRSRAASCGVAGRAVKPHRVSLWHATTPGQRALKGADARSGCHQGIFARSLLPSSAAPTAEQFSPASPINHGHLPAWVRRPGGSVKERFMLQRDGDGGPAADSLTFSMISAAP